MFSHSTSGKFLLHPPHVLTVCLVAGLPAGKLIKDRAWAEALWLTDVERYPVCGRPEVLQGTKQ